jgi:hypothetical protein
LLSQVSDEDADDPKRQVQVGGQIGDSDRLPAALKQPPVLGTELGFLLRFKIG